MADLDALIENAVIYSELLNGTDPTWLSANADRRSVAVIRNATSGANLTNARVQWTQQEEEFVRANYMTLTDAEMATALGRSVDGVQIRRERWLRLPGRSQSSEILNSRSAARMMGVSCAKSISRLIDDGILRASTLPLEAKMYAIQRYDLVRFALNPLNWIYFKPERVADPTLRRQIAIRRKRWNDDWWSVGQTAAYHGCNITTINHYIRKGQIPAKRWGNHWILRSDAIRAVIRVGRSNWHTRWTPRADAFILYGRAVGLSYGDLERLTGIENAAEHIAHLWRKGLVTDRIAQLPIMVDRERKRLYLPYRAARGRLAFVDRAVTRFLAGQKLTDSQARIILGAMSAWANWYAKTPDQQRLARRLESRSGTSVQSLSAYYNQLYAMGFRF